MESRAARDKPRSITWCSFATQCNKESYLGICGVCHEIRQRQQPAYYNNLHKTERIAELTADEHRTVAFAQRHAQRRDISTQQHKVAAGEKVTMQFSGKFTSYSSKESPQ